MSINDIQLNPGQLAKLYGKSLVLAGNGPQKARAAQVLPVASNLPSAPVSGPKMPAQPQPVPQPAAATVPATETPVKYLGNFSKKILLLVNYPGLANLPDEQLSFLTTILNACKLSVNDVGILNMAQHPGITFERLQEELNPVCFILFGLQTTDIKAPLRIPDFQVQPLGNISLLSSPALDKMNVPGEEGKQLKGQLWLSLKKIFNI